MQGRPLLRVIGLSLLLVAIGFPLSRAMHRESKPVVVTITNPSLKVTLDFQFTATGSPESIQIQQEGKLLIDWKQGDDLTTQTLLAVPQEGTDLVISAKWSDQQLHALQVRISDKGRILLDQTFWATEHLHDAIFLPGAIP